LVFHHIHAPHSFPTRRSSDLFGEPVVIKQYLDLGLHTLLVPMVETADHARELVRACRYPPHGIRGVSSATSRGADFGRDGDYLQDRKSTRLNSSHVKISYAVF